MTVVLVTMVVVKQYFLGLCSAHVTLQLLVLLWNNWPANLHYAVHIWLLAYFCQEAETYLFELPCKDELYYKLFCAIEMDSLLLHSLYSTGISISSCSPFDLRRAIDRSHQTFYRLPSCFSAFQLPVSCNFMYRRRSFIIGLSCWQMVKKSNKCITVYSAICVYCLLVSAINTCWLLRPAFSHGC